MKHILFFSFFLLLPASFAVYGKSVTLRLDSTAQVWMEADFAAALTSAGVSAKTEITELRLVSTVSDACWNLVNCQKVRDYFNDTSAVNLHTLDLSDACFANRATPDENVTGNSVFGRTASSRGMAIKNAILPAGLVKLGRRTFYQCDSLTTINLPETLTQIPAGVFSQCTRLRLASLPEAVTLIGNSAFTNCREITLSALPACLTTLESYAFASCPKITVSSIPNGVVSIPSYAFRGCSAITSMTFPTGLGSIGQNAFLNTPLTQLSFKGTGPPELGITPFSNTGSIAVIVPSDTNLGQASLWKQAPWTAFKSVTASLVVPVIPANPLELAYMRYGDLLTIASGIREANSRYLPAYQKLITDANALLNITPGKVTDGDTPPSGDVHDFFTIGKYSWPNPNTPDGLPYIRIDCQVNQEAYGDKYDLQRYQDMVGRVSTLSLAWFYSQDEIYAAKAAELLRVWYIHPETKMNPNFNCAAALPGVSDGDYIGIIFGGVMIKMLDHVKLLNLSVSWTEADNNALKSWFAAFNTWMQDSNFGKREAQATNNHGGWYAAQVAAYSLYTGNMARLNEMVTLAEAQIGSQIDADGSMPRELARATSFSYSNYGLQAFTVMASLAEYAGADLWHYQSTNGRSLKLAWNFLAPYIAGEKAWNFGEQRPAQLYTGGLTYIRKMAEACRDTAYIRITNLLTAASSSSSRVAWLEGVLSGDEQTSTSENKPKYTHPEIWKNPCVSIYDMLGKLLSVQRTETGTVDISGLSPGLYVAKAGARSVKFIKNNNNSSIHILNF